MSSNKKAKEELIRCYGAECFVEKLHLRKDTTPRKYTGKGQMKRMKMLTYHHIKMKKDRWSCYQRKWGPAFRRKSPMVSPTKFRCSRLYERFISRIQTTSR